eukprot:s1050_g5.t2
MTVPIISTDKDGKLAPQQQRMAAAQSLKRRFRKVTLMDCIARMVVNESVRLDSGSPVWIYHCHIEFMPLDELCKARKNTLQWPQDRRLPPAMAAPALALQCRTVAERLRRGHALPVATAWDEDAEEAAQHVARYAAWSKGHPSAAAGMEKASKMLKKASAALKLIQDKICELQRSVENVEASNVAKAEDLFGRGPEKELQRCELTQLAQHLADAAAKSMEMTSEIPGSTVWVQLPDPMATAQQLEQCAEALEQGDHRLEHLHAALLAFQRRLEVSKAWDETAESPRKRCRVQGDVVLSSFAFFREPKVSFRPQNESSSVEGWSRARQGIKGLSHKSKLDVAVQILNEAFHVFDFLVKRMARLFEELTCLECDVSCFHAQLLAAAEIQAEVMGWKLMLLEATELPQGLGEFLESVLAVGDQLDASLWTLQKKRQARPSPSARP